MGYTHYYEYSPEAITPEQAYSLCMDVKTLIEASDVPVVGWDGEKMTEPEVNPEGRIAFNGVGADAHESFVIDFTAPQKPEQDDRYGAYAYEQFIRLGRRRWQCCKTARKPYDEIVTATLLAAKERLGDQFDVSSDGYWSEWADGRVLCAGVFGAEPECPWGSDER